VSEFVDSSPARRIRAFVIGVPLGYLMGIANIPGVSLPSVFVGQFRIAWIVNSVSVFSAIIQLLFAGGLVVWWIPDRLVNRMSDAAPVAFTVTGLCVILWALKALAFDPVDAPRAGKLPRSEAPLAWAILLGPTGLAQFLQRQWWKAWLFTMASYPILRILVLHAMRPPDSDPSAWHGLVGLYIALYTMPYGAESQWFLWLLLGILWLAAIWDAWDTQRKARQAEPAGEGGLANSQ